MSAVSGACVAYGGMQLIILDAIKPSQATQAPLETDIGDLTIEVIFWNWNLVILGI